VEALRQWRDERIKAKDDWMGDKGKGTGKGKKSKKRGKKAKGKGKGKSSAAATQGNPPLEPAGGKAGGAAAVEGAAAAEAQQQTQVEESHQLIKEEREREECAVCLQDLELEDDEDPWGDEGGEGEALVVLRCGHRFHKICGDMWCAKCADKGWGVTCPGCRAPYVPRKK
jgi:hypothetical protein